MGSPAVAELEYPHVGPLRAVRDEELSAYERDGVCVLSQIIPPVWVDFLRAAIDRFRARPDHSALDYANGSGPQFFTQTFAWLLDDSFRAFNCHGPARDIAAQVLAPTTHLNLLMDQVFVKEAGAAAGTPYHQDEPYGFATGEGNLRIWIPLDEVGVDSGPVHYLLGSHRWGRLFSPIRFDRPGRPEADSPFEDPPDFAADYDQFRWLVATCRPGDAILHHARTVHGGPPNVSAQPRRAYTVNYCSDRVRYNEHAAELTQARLRDIAAHVEFPPFRAGQPLAGEVFPRVWPA